MTSRDEQRRKMPKIALSLTHADARRVAIEGRGLEAKTPLRMLTVKCRTHLIRRSEKATFRVRSPEQLVSDSIYFDCIRRQVCLHRSLRSGASHQRGEQFAAARGSNRCREYVGVRKRCEYLFSTWQLLARVNDCGGYRQSLQRGQSGQNLWKETTCPEATG